VGEFLEMDEAQLDDPIGTVNVFRHKLEKYVRLNEQDKVSYQYWTSTKHADYPY
jgi:hypothetical protein